MLVVVKVLHGDLLALLTSARILCLVGCCFSSVQFSSVQFSSVQDGICYAPGKAHMRSTPSLGSFPNGACIHVQNKPSLCAIRCACKPDRDVVISTHVNVPVKAVLSKTHTIKNITLSKSVSCEFDTVRSPLPHAAGIRLGSKGGTFLGIYFITPPLLPCHAPPPAPHP